MHYGSQSMHGHAHAIHHLHGGGAGGSVPPRPSRSFLVSGSGGGGGGAWGGGGFSRWLDLSGGRANTAYTSLESDHMAHGEGRGGDGEGTINSGGTPVAPGPPMRVFVFYYGVIAGYILYVLGARGGLRMRAPRVGPTFSLTFGLTTSRLVSRARCTESCQHFKSPTRKLATHQAR